MHSISPVRVSRRNILNVVAGAAVLGGMAVSSPMARARGKRTSPFVLVHPAWHGGWCWKKVAILLRLRGHDVHAPTLTGLGERSHLARPEVGLDTHVEDVVSMLKYEDLTDVVLVGHSSSGMVVTGVADRVPGQLRHIVYLDAFVPEDGQALVDLLPPERRQGMEAFARTEGEGWLLPRFGPAPWEQIVREQWGVDDEADMRWMLARLVATPFRHFTDPVHRSSAAAERIPCTYIRCLRYPQPGFDRYAAMARSAAGWRCREISSSHHPAITHPRELVELLLEVVQ
jgi:pimeloyl-ACP methyl ester carboxylesterase